LSLVKSVSLIHSKDHPSPFHLSTNILFGALPMPIIREFPLDELNVTRNKQITSKEKTENKLKNKYKILTNQ
jgi:hypothetical protein